MKSGSCFCAPLCTAVVLLLVPSLALQQPPGNLSLLQVSIHTCGNSRCTTPTNLALCKCDQLCAFFGDCCIDAPQTVFTHQDTSLSLEPNFRCISTEIQNDGTTRGRPIATHYWMIGTCPYTDTAIKERRNKDRFPEGTAFLCETDRFSSPPMTDTATGLVYKNSYCASCHGIPEERLSPWSSFWACLDSFQEVIDRAEDEEIMSVDIETVLQSCDPTVFDEFVRADEDSDTQFKYPLRQCTPLVYSCQEQQFSQLLDPYYQKLAIKCNTEPVNVTTSVTSGTVYKNIYCALCNEPSAASSSQLQCLSSAVPSQETFAAPNSLVGGFTLLLDITGTGEQVVRDEDIIVTSMKSASCAEGQVYDFYSNICRDTLCLPGYIYNGVGCVVITKGNSSEGIHSNCSLIALDETEYLNVSNSTIYWIEVDIITPVLGYTSDGAPLVCTNFTTNYTITYNETTTLTIFQYPVAFPFLTYVGLSVDILASILLLFTYCYFKDLRTFYGKLLMNFVSAVLLGDIIFLGGTATYTYYQEEILCQTLAITVHYVFLARFAWMMLLSLKLTVTFYKAAKFITRNEEFEQSCRHLFGYMALGWLAPLVIIGATTAFNFILPGTVDYGRNGLCWINQPVATIISFVAPLGFCLILNGAAFIYIIAVLLKIGCKAVGKHQRGRRTIRNFRVVMATLVVTGLTWGFGFVAILDPSLSWAWYPYLVLNTTQALFVAVAYLCSVKVFQLYRGACINLCPCLSCHRSEGATTPKRNKQVAPPLTSTASSNSPELDLLEDSLVQIVNDSRFYVALSDHDHIV